MGFEPMVLQSRTAVFKTATINHSDTPPTPIVYIDYSITSKPVYGRRTSGTIMLPSACW